MKIIATDLPEVVLLEPRIFRDDRGWFMESFNLNKFVELTDFDKAFVQDNHSFSQRGVLRGLHYQVGAHPQDKLVRVLDGEIFDVAVDIRRSSPNFGRWVGSVLSAENKRQMWVPAGFAHGFLVLSESAEVCYKVSDVYDPAGDRAIRWDDPAMAIDWPLGGLQPRLSSKDADAPWMKEAELFES